MSLIIKNGFSKFNSEIRSCYFLRIFKWVFVLNITPHKFFFFTRKEELMSEHDFFLYTEAKIHNLDQDFIYSLSIDKTKKIYYDIKMIESQIHEKTGCYSTASYDLSYFKMIVGNHIAMKRFY